MLYHLVKTFIWAFRLIPLPLLKILGIVLGWTWFYILPIRKKVMYENLNRAFGGEKSEKEIRRLARISLTYQVFNVIENLVATKHINKGNMDRYFNFRAYTQNPYVIDSGGVLILTAHFGNWELLTLAVSLHGLQLTVMIRPFKNKDMNRLLEEYRESFGFKTLPPANCAPEIRKRLSDGAKIGFAFDQYAPPGRAVEAKFFGHTAYTFGSLARFAQCDPYPVVPAFFVREGFMKHRLIVLDPVPFERCGDAAREIAINTQRYNDILEAVIRQYPEQWMWLHKRWKAPKLQS
ncbi:MAG: lysophospholipid acyltransferase family protein [Myxococcota bacterium]